MPILDLYDQRILCALDRNAKQTLSELARAVRLGRDLVSYRVDRLERGGYITGFYAVINPFRLGFTVYKTFLKLQSKPAELRALFKAIRSHSRVYWSALTDGAWDLFFTCVVGTPTEFWNIQQQLLAPFDSIILEKEFATNMSFDMYSRGYFGTGKRQMFVLGGDPIADSHSTEERRLLWILSERCRIDSVEAGRLCGLSAAAVRGRIERFEEQGVIAGYKIEVNLDKFRRTLFKARIYTSSLSSEQQAALEAYCFGISEITYLVRQLGSCPIELTIEALDYRHFNEIIHALKERFSGEVQRVETLLMREESYKWWLS